MAFEFGKSSSAAPPKAPRQLTASEAKARQRASATAEEKIALEEERIFRRGVVSIKDLIAPATFNVEPSYLVLGDTYVRTIFVVGYPRYINLGWFSPVINLSYTLDVGMFFYPIKAEVVLKQLKKKVGILEAQIYSDAERGMARDPILEAALRDVEDLRDSLSQGIEQFFQFALYVTIYATDKKELDKVSDEVESLFGTKLIYTKRTFYQAEQGFNSTMPIGNDELMISFNMNSSPIAASFPFISADLTSDNGVLFGVNRHNSSLILFDRFSLPNANAVVFATSGAGKSFAVKLEILRSLMLGTEVIVIDPEMEYRYLSDAVGGTYINVSLSSEAKINPFDLPRAVGEEKSTEDIIRSAVITVKGLLKIILGTITPQEDSILDKALLETYSKKDITPDVDLAKVEPPIMQDLIEVLEGIEGSKDLVTKLSKFTDGTFAGLFNSPTTVKTKNLLVVFSVRDLEDELRPLAIYAIINYIWNTIRAEKKKRILVIDEGWWLMQHEDSAKFIHSIVKRCRKYYMGVTTISQDVQDFLGSQYGRAIITNSSLQLLLRQSPAAVDAVQKTFLLTDSEKQLLLQAGVGQGIFFAGSKHAAIQVVASETEKRLVTSNPQELLELEAARQSGESSEAEEIEEEK